MQDGDLALWEQPKIMLVLEETLAIVTGRHVRPSMLSHKEWVPDDPDAWEWGELMIKTI